MDKFIDDFDKIECIKAEFEQKSYIKLYKIWKTAKGEVYIKKNRGIIWIYPDKITGVYNDRIFLFGKGYEPYIKKLSKDDPVAFLWKKGVIDEFDIKKKKKGWQFVMKKNRDYKATIIFNDSGLISLVKQTDLFGNITTFKFNNQQFECNFSINRMIEDYSKRFEETQKFKDYRLKSITNYGRK